MKIRPVGAVLFHADGRTDRPIEIQGDGHNEAASRISQFLERA